MSWNWDRLRVFFEVVECGTFTAAAKRLKLSQPAVSRQISTLEQELGITLFHRDYKGLVLTEIGEEVFKTSACLKAEVDLMESRIANNQDTPVGPLRLTTSVAFGAAWLSPLMGDFHQEYPDVKISLLLSDQHEMSLSTREADVAIRFAPQTKPCLIQKKLMELRYHLYASDSYLKNRGTPNTIEDLYSHDIVVYGNDVPAPVSNINWLLEMIRKNQPKFEPALSVANVHGILHAIQSGVGVGALPKYLVGDDHNLVEVLPDISGPQIEVYFVYLEEMRNAKRLNVLRDFLVKHASQNKLN
ncbi:MAG: LysR family transcriptional regulator [Acidiferrobacteraceae bacterium]|nr:LysR family transcriptional regulator [Acidiferrobacteraceae bacterium]|tara:strand:+ start:1018 stop:1920 length:903 start_codon:yes stop_codon:yes gene_type:complete